jgi:hypothetical protein
MIKWLLIFAVTVVYDYVWAKYTKAVGDGKILRACLSSGVLFALGGVVIVEYTREPWLLTAAVSGAVLGTYWAMRV